jgi:hypothetical protein
MKPKTYRVELNIGRCKYCLVSWDGVKTHRDGSQFHDLEIFSNKKRIQSNIRRMTKNGWEAAS